MTTANNIDAMSVRYCERFPALCASWDRLCIFIYHRAYGPDDAGEERSQEWTTTAMRLSKLGQRIRGVMDTAMGDIGYPLSPVSPSVEVLRDALLRIEARAEAFPGADRRLITIRDIARTALLTTEPKDSA